MKHPCPLRNTLYCNWRHLRYHLDNLFTEVAQAMKLDKLVEWLTNKLEG